MLEKFKKFARTDGDSSELAFRKLFILLIALVCCACGCMWSGLYLVVFGWGLTAFLPFLFVLIVGSAILFSHYLRNYKILVFAQLICITWISALIQWSIGSLDQSGFVSAWSFLGPIGAVIFLSRKQAIGWMLMFLVIIVISAVFNPSLSGYRAIVSESTRTLFYIMNIGMASSVVFAASAWFAGTIQNEKKRSESLLLNILPVQVAEELKTNGKVEPKHYDEATVLFTDFKGFTKIAESFSAEELVTEINLCFSKFDEIITLYNIEKIKTIGDAYMAVGGEINDKICPPCNVVKAALEMQQFMIERKKALEMLGKTGFEMRLGIHTGPIIAGVVGVKKFQYDIWGDTVNIASRMESSGEVGMVNISRSTFDLVGEQFSCTHRGKVQAKGKGEVDMYFVTGKLG